MRRLWLAETATARRVRHELSRMVKPLARRGRPVNMPPVVGVPGIPPGMVVLIDTSQVVYDPVTGRWSAPPGAVTIGKAA